MATLHKEMSAADLPSVARDVTKPGAPQAKTKQMAVTEQLGHAPLIWNPIYNRGTNFSWEERKEKGVEGLLPPVVETLGQQCERVMLQIRAEPNGLEKYEVLNQLATTNETLFYHTVIHNLEELAPVIYTPTVGEACVKYDRIFRQPLGMYFSGFEDQRGRYYEIMRNWPSYKVQIIVVTDGGRILGLGDLGTNGMGIPVGKIALYVAGGGFHPDHSLPACLDLGTDNEELLQDKLYLGHKKKRLDGEEHMAAVEEFCMAAQKRFPNCLIQFEDFQTDKAFAILNKFRDQFLCFNDDIQGTGAVVLTGVINGLKAQGIHPKDARVVFYGAGSSAVGVAQMIVSMIQTEGGKSEEDAKKAIYMVDSKGLITTTRGDELPSHKQSLARTDGTPDMRSLKEVIAHAKPTALIGLTGGGPAWDKDVIEELCKHQEKPLVFPLSNPTDKAEITAKDAYEFSKGKCIFAAGSPFDPVEYDGKKFVPGQANNVLIFPGVGFGGVMVKSKAIKDEMLIAASKALADYVSPEDIQRGKIYPDLKELRNVSAKVSTAVATAAFDLGIAGIPRPDDIEKYIRSKMWLPGKNTFDDEVVDTRINGNGNGCGK